MLCAHRLPAVRLCLLFLAAVLSSAAVLALAASADPSRAAAASLPGVGASVPAAGPVSKQRARHRKSSSARRAECAAAARTEKARKACAVKKAKGKGTKPSASPKLAATAPSSPPSVATGIPAPVIAGPPPAEALAVPGPESTPPAESPGGSDKPPVESKTPTTPVEPPVEPKPPIEPIPPVEEPKAPVEEPKPPVEESKPPVEESKPPVEESKPPVEEPKPPVEESKPPVEESKPPVEEPKPPVEAPPTGKASTTTTLSSSLDPSMVGQAVTYTATVNAIAATGSITFEDAGTAIAGCVDQTVSFGAATCTLPGYAAAGTQSITATYNGDSNYIGSTSSLLNQVVSQASTSTALTSSVNPSIVWQSVTYTAKVSPAAATGTVAFDEAGTPIVGCTAEPVGSGTATCTHLGYTVAGTHSITASYSGDGNHLPSASSSLKQVVDNMGTTHTTTALSSSSNPSIVGQAVTYTATVGPAAATGTITFKEVKEGGIAIPGCINQTILPGTAMTCTTTYSTAGWHQIIAVYSGNNTYATSTSPALTQVIHGTPTTVTVSSSLNPSTVGQAVTYTATVSPATATGTVEFTSNDIPISGCTAQIVSSGSATCTTTFSAAGGPWIRAVYSGDSTHATSTFSHLDQTINKNAGTTTLVSSANPSIVGQAVTYTATVSPAAATGTITFKEVKEGGIAIPGCINQAIIPGTAMTCTTTYSIAGWHQIIAVYSGDNTYATSTSPTLAQVIHGDPTTVTLSSALNPSIIGQAVTYTATVNPATATGTVAFREAGTPIAGCTAQSVSSGTATCTVSSYSAWSSYFITAAYSGDVNNLASVSPVLTQTVEPPPVASGSPFRYFSPASFWNEELPTDAPLDPSSAEVVGAFDAEITKEEEAKMGSVNILTSSWSVPIYTVPADQPTVKVRVTTENIWATPALQSAWDAVPLPAEAKPAAGTDKHLVVWQPSTDQLWEFWQLEDTSEGWQAGWGGAMQNASSDPGVYGPEAWPGAGTGWGASASSLSIAGGLITLEDLEKGVINHALAIGIPAPRAGVYASPAQRTDGTSTSPLSLPEGAHLRLEPGLDLAALHLPRLTLMIAEAAQRYGIVVRDTAGQVTFYAQDPTPTGTNPYIGAHGYFEGEEPSGLLASFPWSHLQLLKMELHSTS